MGKLIIKVIKVESIVIHSEIAVPLCIVLIWNIDLLEEVLRVLKLFAFLVVLLELHIAIPCALDPVPWCLVGIT